MGSLFLYSLSILCLFLSIYLFICLPMPLSDPLLNKILANWRGKPERPPLLLDETSEEDWKWLKGTIVEIFTGSPFKPDHPDILILERDPQKNGLDIEQTRNFIGQLSLSHYEMPFKIGLIPAAHHLNIPSQNALLKTFEEPLKNRYLILGTTAKNKLLPTILSRLMIINFSSHSKTRPGLPLREDILDFYQECRSSSLPERLRKGQVWSEGGTEKINDFFDSIVPILQKKLEKKLAENLNRSNIKTAREIIGQLETALNYSEQLGRTSGANSKLLFEAFLLKIPIEKE